MLSARGLYVGLIVVQKSPTECGVSECDVEASKEEALTQRRAEAPQETKIQTKKHSVLD